LAEGVSNTILEAMATGLPVIATAVGANADLVRDGETGRIVPPADVESLAVAIIELATQQERALAMGRAGRSAAEARFSLRSMVSMYQSLYDSQLHARAVTGRAAAGGN
jgi:glycosyltransferase involved in cell wall biosynthesis